MERDLDPIWGYSLTLAVPILGRRLRRWRARLDLRFHQKSLWISDQKYLRCSIVIKNVNIHELYIYNYIYTSVFIRHIISHYQPISAIDMTLWLSHSQPPWAPGPLGHGWGEGLAECQSPRWTERCHQVAWVGGCWCYGWCTMVYPPVAKTWTIGYKYGGFWGEII